MANAVLRSGQFPVGTSVSAYARSKFPVSPQQVSGPLPGGLTADATATVAADGSLTFTGLADATSYVAYASVNGVDTWLAFRISSATGGPAQDISDRSGRQLGVVTEGAPVTLDAESTPGSAIPGKGVAVGGSDGANLRLLKVAADGTLTTSQASGSAMQVLDSAGANKLAVDSTGRITTVEARPATPTLTNVAASLTNVTLLASNAAARLRAVFNDSTANLFLKFGATASASSFTVKIAAGAYYEFPQPLYTGQVDGLWDAANGNARLTEVT